MEDHFVVWKGKPVIMFIYCAQSSCGVPILYIYRFIKLWATVRNNFNSWNKKNCFMKKRKNTTKNLQIFQAVNSMCTEWLQTHQQWLKHRALVFQLKLERIFFLSKSRYVWQQLNINIPFVKNLKKKLLPRWTHFDSNKFDFIITLNKEQT